MLSGSFIELKQGLKKLPGIGEKTATRLAMYLIRMPKDEATGLGEAIIKTVSSFSNCSICNILSDVEPCIFCTDSQRDQRSLCLVEDTQDAYLIEDTNEFKGRYFVLGNLLSPMDGIGPNEINFPLLQEFLAANPVEELILALSPSVEGESTINFLVNQLQDKVDKITRLSTGLPFGGDMEYATSRTLTTALQRRYSADK
ncbi:MAG: recombination mediator RecR [Candidatus Cloacimonetes bacterium]|nr:recombination mediator RecR [Candidatus Cloacimonadota bacterium]